jgi:diketogulonate reductase-like aldo/keto reductase
MSTVPSFIYGTAWKEDKTQALTELALRQGFRAIDTANQRKHYYEAGVGSGIANALRDGVTTRDELFLQTKFTYRRGQDHRLPYDLDKPIATQVTQSFHSSLEHLQTDYIDCYVLHGPSSRSGLTEDDWAAWRSMEEIHASGRAKCLGVSNVSFDQLKALCHKAEVAPRFVQNRCYASRAWDRETRRFCIENNIVYQGFSLLTANREIVKHPELIEIARRHRMSINQTIFRFAIDVGMVPLTGTTNDVHMKHDLLVKDFSLSDEEVVTIEKLALS